MDWCELKARLQESDMTSAQINADAVSRAFKAGQPPEEFAPALAALAATFIDYGIKYVQTQLQKEAKSYTAQFSINVAEAGFWTSSSHQKRVLAACAQDLYVNFGQPSDQGWLTDDKSLLQRLVALEFVRKTKSYSPAFDFVALMVPSQHNDVFLLQPIYLLDNSAKAKILARRPWAPWTYLPMIHAGNTVRVKTNITMSAIWVDNNQAAHTETIASFDLPDETVVLGEPKKDFPKGGWFQGVPLTEQIGGNGVPASGANGAFWVNITVTEQDPSNAEQYIKEAAQAVSDNKSKIESAITSNLKR
jgi:hypothetical protein